MKNVILSYIYNIATTDDNTEFINNILKEENNDHSAADQKIKDENFLEDGLTDGQMLYDFAESKGSV